jgi:hypothetical protein
LRAYVLARRLSHPSTDVLTDIREFTDAYYGKAAPNVRAYLELLHQQVRDGKIHAHLSDRPTAGYLNDAFLAQADKFLNEAEQMDESDAIKSRVQVVRLPIWYVRIASNRVTGEARAELITRFLQIARRAGISNISEGQSLQNWAAKVK